MKTGIQQNVLNDILNERSKPTLEDMQKICSVFQTVEVRWLFMGEGKFRIPEKPITGNKLAITIRIEDEILKLRIERWHEEFYRKAAKLLKERASAYKLEHPIYLTKRILKLMAFQYAVDIERSKGNNKAEITHEVQLYKIAAVNVIEKTEYFNNQCREFSKQKILAMSAYHFALVHSKNTEV